MSGILMAWGPHLFMAGKTSFEELRRHAAGRWADHEIIGRRTAGQYLGPAKGGLKLHGTIAPLYTGIGTEAQVRAMEADCEAGATALLLAGTGDVLGDFALVAMDVSETEHLGSGYPQKVAYDLEFARYGGGDGTVWSIWP